MILVFKIKAQAEKLNIASPPLLNNKVNNYLDMHLKRIEITHSLCLFPDLNMLLQKD